jgi:hypothetical protein
MLTEMSVKASSATLLNATSKDRKQLIHCAYFSSDMNGRESGHALTVLRMDAWRRTKARTTKLFAAEPDDVRRPAALSVIEGGRRAPHEHWRYYSSTRKGSY